MPRSLLTVIVQAFGLIILFAIFGVALPFALVINAVISFLEAIAWIVVAIVIWEISWLKWSKRQKLTDIPLGRPEAWFFVLGLFFSIIAAGSALVNLSTFGAQTISSSTCVIPANVTVTSPSCTKIQTIAQAPAGGLYSIYGPYGAILVLLGVFGLPAFLIVAVILYLWTLFLQNQEGPAKPEKVETTSKGLI